MKKTQNKYDIIGDIHGHADELESLLRKLGYIEKGGIFRHGDGRRVIFLGDYIDRGPAIQRVLEIVRGMVDAGEALAILGNHEVNAMRYHAKDATGTPLRPHGSKNRAQHKATLDQLAKPAPDEWQSWLNWFAGLPLWLDLGGLRVVHAAWNGAAVDELRDAGRLEGPLLERYSLKKTPKYETISLLLNGPEALLPEGYTHQTADGSARREIRVKWWKDLSGATYREAIFPDSPYIPNLPAENLPQTGYSADAPLTFFGHYALNDPAPSPLAPNLACLDYGTGKGGFLCAYRWDGEESVDTDKFVTTNS